MIKIYALKGMMCTACAANIDHAVRKIEGIIDVNVDFVRNEMKVSMKDDLTEKIVVVVKKAGYEAIPIGIYKEEPKKNNLPVIKLIISYSLLLILMYFSMGKMVGLPYPGFLDNAIILSIIELAITIPIVVLHFNYIIGGVKHLSKFNPDMNSLVALGVLSSLVLGIITIITIAVKGNISNNNLYFDSAAMIVTFVSTGKFIESKSKEKTKASIEELEKLEPKEAHELVGGLEITKPISEIILGSTILIKPGEAVPLDGIIQKGETAIDESTITGESIPTSKMVGSKVISSTINGDGAIEVKTTSTDKNSTIRRIIELVNEASSSKAKVSKLVDTISRYFTPFVIVLSIVTLLIWLIISKDWMSSINRMITVLVVSCPCALGLATPIAILVGSGKAAKIGCIINSVSSLETLHQVKNVIFDKTGTLTVGHPVVKEDIYLHHKEEALTAILSLESLSNHPLALAIKEYALKENGKKADVTNYVSIPGKGVNGQISGFTYYLGSLSYLNENISIDLQTKELIVKALKNGLTPAFLFKKEGLMAILLLRDEPREEAKETIAYLNGHKYQTCLLTGDNETVAKAIGKEMGIKDVFYEVLPENKKEVVASYKKTGKTLMIGDGINDAPALEEADTSMSLGSSTDVAKSSADIILLHNNIYDVINAIRLSKRVIATIAVNLSWAFFYNLIAITLATGALSGLSLEINPMIASLMMSFSSVFVVLNSLSISLFKAQKAEGDKTMDKIELKVDGMMCEHCVSHVSSALQAISGVKTVNVSLKKKNAIVTGEGFNREILVKAVNDAGYQAK